MVPEDEDLAAGLAREIRDAVARAAPAAPGGRHELAAGADEEDVRLPLRRAQEHLTPVVPTAVRFARSKSAMLRLLRFLWRDQASFNALVLEAFQGVLAALARQREEGERRDRDFAEFREETVRRGSDHGARLAHLESRPSGPVASATATSAAAGPGAALPESVYALFEKRFRGSEEEITERQRFYLPFVHDLPGPVFDAGCGRGEFLALLRAEGIAAKGVETSSHAAGACRAAGLDVAQGDAIEALAAAPAASLGGVVAFQVVEHWPAADTFRFLAEARRAIAPGGTLIVETVNTDSLAAMRAFYLDPTHVRPVPPEALRFLCDAAGFRDLRIEYLSPVPAAERLEERSDNDVRLNAVLFGPQDYAVIGRVPAG